MNSDESPFLRLPVELRMLIYEHLIQSSTVTLRDRHLTSRHREYIKRSAFQIDLIGTFPGREEELAQVARERWHPWVLARVCRQVHHETARMLAGISFDDVIFLFHGFTPDDMRWWAEGMGADKIAKIRRFAIEGTNWCENWHRWTEADWNLGSPDKRCMERHAGPHREHMQLERTIVVDLTVTNDTPVDTGDYISVPGFGEERRIIEYDHGNTYLEDSICSVACETCAFRLVDDVVTALHKLIIDPNDEHYAHPRPGSSGGPAGTERRISSPYHLKAIANVEGLAGLVEAALGPEKYDDPVLLERFPTRRMCEEMEPVKEDVDHGVHLAGSF